jgi:hypothetical protein
MAKCYVNCTIAWVMNGNGIGMLFVIFATRDNTLYVKQTRLEV